uniref:Uncharacterized protein n=1 Tax=Timema cristinae TaxID=61476 RepID=A0A7R9DQX1_TIMCR|nr:unnamed protein product [Timema cristinae]
MRTSVSLLCATLLLAAIISTVSDSSGYGSCQPKKMEIKKHPMMCECFIRGIIRICTKITPNTRKSHRTNQKGD